MARRSMVSLACVVAPALLFAAACAGAPTPTPTTAAPAPTKPAAGATAPAKAGDVAAGQAVFRQNCDPCHPGGNAGVGPALKSRGFTDDQIRTQVRNGRGQMPPFPPSTISDQQLTDLVAYVQTLR